MSNIKQYLEKVALYDRDQIRNDEEDRRVLERITKHAQEAKAENI